jgi:hypothetical protein
MNIDKYVTQDSNSFFIDADAWNKENDLPIEAGDLLRFNFNERKYIGKAVPAFEGDSFFELQIVKELN